VEVLHDWAHPVFLVLLVPIVFFASRRSHYDTKITTFLVSGFVLVLMGWLLGHFWLGLLFESSLTLLGSVVLIAGHWFNYRHHQTCKNHQHSHHPVEEHVST
jgi:lipopolysaccharide export LptBFGC system permease protein LptF